MYQNQPVFRVLVQIEPDEDGFHAYSPSLKGLHVWGETREEAFQHARDAAKAMIEVMIRYNEVPTELIYSEDRVPAPSHPAPQSVDLALAYA